MRWQYRTVDLGIFWARERMVGVLARLGATGWELVAIYDKSSNWLQGLEKGFALFKRAVPEGQEPEGAWAEAIYADELDEGREGLKVGEAECLSCGASMPLGVDRCKECGWTYAKPSESN